MASGVWRPLLHGRPRTAKRRDFRLRAWLVGGPPLVSAASSALRVFCCAAAKVLSYPLFRRPMSMTSPRVTLCFVLSTVLFCGAGLVRADVPDAPEADPAARKQAKEHFARGLHLFENGDNAGALTEFEKAHQLYPNRLVMYNIALAYAALAKPVEAVQFLDEVLSEPGSLKPEQLTRARATKEEQERRVGELDVKDRWRARRQRAPGGAARRGGGGARGYRHRARPRAAAPDGHRGRAGESRAGLRAAVDRREACACSSLLSPAGGRCVARRFAGGQDPARWCADRGAWQARGRGQTGGLHVRSARDYAGRRRAWVGLVHSRRGHQRHREPRAAEPGGRSGQAHGHGGWPVARRVPRAHRVADRSARDEAGASRLRADRTGI
jgi:hypothetical protein